MVAREGQGACANPQFFQHTVYLRAKFVNYGSIKLQIREVQSQGGGL